MKFTSSTPLFGTEKVVKGGGDGLKHAIQPPIPSTLNSLAKVWIKGMIFEGIPEHEI